MFRQIAIFLVAIVAFTSAFAPAARFGSRVNTALDAARCEVTISPILLIKRFLSFMDNMDTL